MNSWILELLDEEDKDLMDRSLRIFIIWVLNGSSKPTYGKF